MKVLFHHNHMNMNALLNVFVKEWIAEKSNISGTNPRQRNMKVKNIEYTIMETVNGTMDHSTMYMVYTTMKSKHIFVQRI